MSIEIVVGLPHLGRGALLARVAALRAPALISANSLSRWREAAGARRWRGFNPAPLANAEVLASLDLDSAGFVAAQSYGGFPWTAAAYVALAAAYPFRRFASLDYCTEPEIACDREEVLDRLSRTIRANRDCRMLAADYGILDRLMPVIQGRSPSDYERCIDALWQAMTPGTVLGVGSMCRREIAGPEGLVAVFEHLDRVLPAGVPNACLNEVIAPIDYLTMEPGLRRQDVGRAIAGVAKRMEALLIGALFPEMTAAIVPLLFLGEEGLGDCQINTHIDDLVGRFDWLACMACELRAEDLGLVSHDQRCAA